MKYENYRKFRHTLLELLNKTKVMQSPIREKFFRLSWRIYNSLPNGKVKLFANRFEKNRYEYIIKEMMQNRIWGSYLYLITDGDPKRFLY